jgi:hypothetical protein
MVCGRSRYLDGSEAKVKEVTLELEANTKPVDHFGHNG